MMRANQAVYLAGILVIAGCSRSNDEALSKTKADTHEARAEAVKSEAEADPAKAESAKLASEKIEEATKPASQPESQSKPPYLVIDDPKNVQEHANGLNVEVNGAVDSNGGVTRIVWNWGDDTPESTSWFPAKHHYEKPGTYEIRVTAYDGSGKTSTRMTSATVSESP